MNKSGGGLEQSGGKIEKKVAENPIPLWLKTPDI